MFALIDNYDSFTWNLYHLIAGHLQSIGHPSASEVRVWRNDQIAVDALLALKPKAIILSPGPCNPDKAGISLKLIEALNELSNPIPLLGVCLGHQALGQALGGKIIRTSPRHGKLSSIRHNQDGLFTALPSPLAVVRYHSLIIDKESLPKDLAVSASADNDIIMAVSHRQKPFYGVQFHPESIATEQGAKLIANFVRLASTNQP